jgi:hypothetical protein
LLSDQLDGIGDRSSQEAKMAQRLLAGANARNARKVFTLWAGQVAPLERGQGGMFEANRASAGEVSVGEVEQILRQANTIQKAADELMLAMGMGNENPYRNADGTIRVPERASSFVDPALTHLEAKLKELVDNQNQADGLYDQIPDSKNGKVIGTDIARELLPEYAANREGKILYTHATGRMAQAYAKDRLWREIQNPRGRTELMFTAGGVAAGKSTAVTEGMVAASDLVFDGTLRETDWAIETIEEALKNGWNVEINYVQRPIDLVIRGAISRADRGGRWGSLAVLPSVHQAAQASAIRLFKHFQDRPQFRMNLLAQ